MISRWLLAWVVCVCAPIAQAQRSDDWRDRVMPRPQTMTDGRAGSAYILPSQVAIVVPSGSASLREIGSYLARELQVQTGVIAHVQIGAVAATPKNSIRLDTTRRAENRERYVLEAAAAGVLIDGASSDAVRWGAQTLLQLLVRERGQWQLPPLRIEDEPRFAWRGSMLDVGRHLLTVRDIEKHIDVLARYKMNVLHWHLTEDQGWRIEIKRYPRLTSVGAFRREPDGTRYGGFYTQTQVHHLVEYARIRGITIVPEIEMPGHSSAAIAAYPALGCGATPVNVANSWGVFADIYCVGKPETLEFLFNVLDEVMELFPSPVIHIGGDEAPKEQWKACASCQALMQRERLADEEALQSWFMQRIAAHVAKRGRRVLGWDEVLDGPYLANGMVHSWRDSSFTRKAAERGHDVIASPNEFTYLNRTAAELPLARVYGFDPVPPSMSAAQVQRVRGGEVPLWSEHIVSGANLELMALPRLLAFAEVMWSALPNPQARDYGAFTRRLTTWQLPALRAREYAVGPLNAALAAPSVLYDSLTRTTRLRLPAMADGIVLRGTNDGTPPRASSPLYRDGAELRALSTLRLQAFWGAHKVREERRIAFARHVGVGARTTTSPAVDARYPGTGAWNLADGMLGSTDHGDGLWQGWWVPEVTMTLALPAPADIASVQTQFLQNVRSWIVLPGTVSFAWSADSVTWSEPVPVSHPVPANREGALAHTFAATLPAGSRARFIRVTATSRGPLPAEHPGAGQPAWMFADEIVVRARAPRSNTQPKPHRR